MDNTPRQIGDYVTATDPNRERMAASYSVVPGGPQNNNPMNVTSINGGPNTYPSAYGDLTFNGVPQLQTVMPLVQNIDPRAGDQLLGNHQARDAQFRGLNPSMMGPVGMPVDMRQPLPGGSVPSSQQAPNTMPLQTPPPEQMAQQNAMGSRMNKGNRGPGGMRT